MDGNLDAVGMTADLEAMREAGIGGAIMLEVDIGVPRGPVGFMSPKWRSLLVHAVREAERLGIELALGSGPGWCGTGGPWVKPEQSMQHLVASETVVEGPVRFERVLDVPKPRKPFFGEGTLTPELAKAWRGFYRDVAVLAVPTPRVDRRLEDIEGKALYQRAPYSSQPGVKSALPMPAEHAEWPEQSRVAANEVVDLTDRMTPEGRLTWDAPAGRWTLLRFGRTATGQTTRPAPLPGLGFESDKFDPAAVDAHLDQYVGVLLRELGPRRATGGGLTTLHFDSWEMSAQNWSGAFREEFRRRRGYDPLPLLPAYLGMAVGSVERAERFLWDVRRTAQELVISNHVTRLRDFAHRNGLRFSSEPYDMNPCADLSLGAVADVPMAEFWWLGFDTFHTAIEAASIAHTQGREVVAAEAFTSDAGEDWRAHPGNLKSMGDWAFAAGVNRIAFHRYQHQPWLDRFPGMRMGIYGVHWERTQTWWPMAWAYHDYLARCQYLLRQGRPVADILFLAAEGAPHVFRAPPSATTEQPPDRREYNFDGCAPETLMSVARADAGAIVFPGGARYRLLVLPNEPTMSPGLLRTIEALVEAGVSVVGPPPSKAPGLEGYPDCDREVRELAGRLWSVQAGKKRVLWGPEFADAASNAVVAPRRGPDISTRYAEYGALARHLRVSGVVPDFESDGPIRYAHRSAAEAELYFVSNRRDARVEATCRFRVAGRKAELWHPVTAERRALTVRDDVGAGISSVTLAFEPHEAYFVVFRTEAGTGIDRLADFRPPAVLRAIEGPWQVSFDPKWGAPETAMFERLEDWRNHPDPEIRHYSGRATYRRTFEVAGPVPAEPVLHLGEVRNLARVKLNGVDLGVVWCAPWQVDAGRALRAGTNDLEITVANLWPNRLIGDAGLPADRRRTWTTSNPYKAGAPLLESGLLGPVTLRTREPHPHSR
ncbi:MAG: hypothetical protein JNL97_03420, partial [Verrucomicrobiales bacterium]|nr:hypothetical protein [Verrucomicrobiales bacterium]